MLLHLIQMMPPEMELPAEQHLQDLLPCLPSPAPAFTAMVPLACPLQVDYYIVLKCDQFIGNSVSTFSALAIMERWHADRFATYYNGGNIPLEMFIPLFP